MPIGNCAIIPSIAKHLVQTCPGSVLDLGIGFGMYGAVTRQWLDHGVQPWKTYLMGVEGFGGYRNPVWDLYNVIQISSIQDFLLGNRERFDCVIMSDVIEHFDRQEGLNVIRSLQSLVSAGGSLLIGTPAEFVGQGAVYGNTFECHRSHWTIDDFAAAGFEITLRPTDAQIGFDKALLAVWSADDQKHVTTPD